MKVAILGLITSVVEQRVYRRFSRARRHKGTRDTASWLGKIGSGLVPEFPLASQNTKWPASTVTTITANDTHVGLWRLEIESCVYPLRRSRKPLNLITLPSFSLHLLLGLSSTLFFSFYLTVHVRMPARYGDRQRASRENKREKRGLASHGD